MGEFWNDRLILKVIAGSQSYGTNVEGSDEDYRGICIPPVSHLLGLEQFEQKERKGPDEVIYSLRKFVKLALENNPNIIDSLFLFVHNRHIIFINEYGKELRSLRNDFISKRVFKTYGGYATAQLHKLTNGERNAVGKRAEGIAKHGYDTKSALHLIRLLRMGIEILQGDGVNVYREDRDYLVRVRNGEFTLSEIEEKYKLLNRVLITAYENSDLPNEPNYNKINNWLIDVQKRSLGWEN